MDRISQTLGRLGSKGDSARQDQTVSQVLGEPTRGRFHSTWCSREGILGWRGVGSRRAGAGPRKLGKNLENRKGE